MKMMVIIIVIPISLLISYMTLNYMAPDIAGKKLHERLIIDELKNNPEVKLTIHNKYIGIRIGSNLIDYRYLIADVIKSGSIIGQYYYEKSVFGDSGTILFTNQINR